MKFIILALLISAPFHVQANYSFDFFSKLNMYQYLSSENNKKFNGELSYTEVKSSYVFSKTVRADVDLEFFPFFLNAEPSPLGITLPTPSIKNAYINYNHRKGLSFQVGIKELSLGYYKENLKTFSFVERDLSFRNLFNNQSDFLFATSNFGGFANWRVNRDLRVRGGVSVLGSSVYKKIYNLSSKSLLSSPDDHLKNLSAFLEARYTVRQKKAYKGTVFATFVKQQGDISEHYDSDFSYLNTDKHLIGFGGRTGFKLNNYYTRLRGEVWGAIRNYVAKSRKTTSTPIQKHNETTWSFYLYPEVQLSRKWKAGVFLGGIKSSHKKSTDFENKVRVAYQINKSLSLSGEYFYVNPYNAVNGIKANEAPKDKIADKAIVPPKVSEAPKTIASSNTYGWALSLAFDY